MAIYKYIAKMEHMEDTSKRQKDIYKKKLDTTQSMSGYKLYNICSWSDNKPFPLNCFNPIVPGFFDKKNDKVVVEIIFDGTFNQKGIAVILDNFIMNTKTIIDLVNENSYKRIFIGVLNPKKDKQNWYVLEKTETDAASAFSKNKSMKKKSMKNKSIKKKSNKKKTNKKKSMKNKSIKKKSNKKKSMKKL
jgi:hypothetical protein